MAEPTPGQVISPGGTPEEPSKPDSASGQEVSVSLSHQQPQTNDQPTPPALPQDTSSAPPQPVVTPLPSPPQESIPVSAPQPEASTQSQPVSSPPVPEVSGLAPQFQVEALPEEQAMNLSDTEEVISWTASEYIAHQKSRGWYVMLAVGTVLFSLLVYFLTSGDVISVIVIFLAAIVFGIYAGKKPREQQYSIGPEGIAIGAKLYGFDQLKTFSITDDGAFSSITFWPMKRFMPALSIYYDPQDEERIVETLSLYLPLDTEKRDVVESLMRKIRF